MKITKIYLQYLRNEAHYKYMSIVKQLLEVHVAVAVIVAVYLEEFNLLFDRESKLVDAMKASDYTAKIAEARNRVNRDIVGIGNVVDSALHHFDIEIVKAAESLELRLKPIRNERGKKAYEELAGGISILLDDLNKTYSAQIATLNLNDWVNELVDAHAEFERLLVMRNNERAERPQGSLSKIRKQIDAVYRTIVERIDSYCIINDAEICSQFVKELNNEVAYFNNRYRHKATIDIKRIIVVPIPPQTIDAGLPATPMPEVFYDDKQLVFTVDFELSYSNNSMPGTATVFIHGKGEYKGIKPVSFNIL